MRNARWVLVPLLAASGVVVARSGRGEPGEPADAARAARVELGRRLFFDPAVSRTARVSCASCHIPSHGFTDTAHPSADEWGPTARRTPPLTDLGAGPFHSDGEFATLRELLDARLAPIFLLRETEGATGERKSINVDRDSDATSFGSSYGMSKGDPPVFVSVADRLGGSGLYAKAFADAFGGAAPSHDRILDAMEAYLVALRTAPNALDLYLRDDAAPLPAPAARGLVLFTGRAGCAQCHDVRPVDGRAPMRDGKFHDTGVSLRTALARKGDAAKRPDAGLGAHADRTVERRRDDMKFKTPSLRDVMRRGPFMHDGSLATPLDVIDFYDRGNVPHAGLDPALRRLGLTADEKNDLLAFLFALTGDERAGLADLPPGPRRVRIRLVLPNGEPLASALVEAEPAGDRFRGSPEAIESAIATTDRDGWAEFEFPPTTHVVLRAAGAGVHELVPDCAPAVELIAVPRDQVALRIRAAPKMLPRSVHTNPIAKANPKGRLIAERDAGELDFAFVRRLSDAEAIYVAAAPRDGSASSRHILNPQDSAGGALPAVVDIDLRGGATTSADLTPKAHAADADAGRR